MHQRFGVPIAVVFVLSKRPILYALQKHEFVVLFPVIHSMLAKYVKLSRPAGPKMFLPMQRHQC